MFKIYNKLFTLLDIILPTPVNICFVIVTPICGKEVEDQSFIFTITETNDF